MKTARRFLCGMFVSAVGLCAALTTTSARADVVLQWNDVYLDTCRAVGGPPCPLARTGALLHVAMFDALQAIDREYTPMVVTDEDPELKTNRKATVASAAHRVLTTLYPTRSALYDAALVESLNDVVDGAGETKGVALGIRVADKVLADHADDQPFATDQNYVYGDTPGSYQPTFPDFTTPPMSPGWGHCKGWCMITGSQFRAARGPYGYAKMENVLKSARYAKDFNEVKKFGRRFSKVRTADQTELAWFWANDRNGTYKPPGHMNALAQIVSKDKGLNMAQNARLFALVNVAMADSGLLAWDQKFLSDNDLWRPITAVRNADTDGNPLTEASPDWVPLLEFSPAFPGYVSGHATFGGAWAAVMAGYFGTDNVTFVGTTDEPIVAHVTRTFTSFSQAGYEDAISRIYLGVHLRCDIEDGYAQGYKMGQTLASTFFKKTCKADVTRDGAITPTDLTRFTDSFFARRNNADFNGDGQINNTDVFLFMDAYNAGCR